MAPTPGEWERRGRAAAGEAVAGKSRYHGPLLRRLAIDRHDRKRLSACLGRLCLRRAGCLLVWFQLTGWMWRWLREPLRLLVAVLLLTPTVVDPGKDALAPAIAIVAMDLLLKVGDNAWRATADLFSYGLLAFGAYLAFALVRWPVEGLLRRRQPAAPPPVGPRQGPRWCSRCCPGLGGGRRHDLDRSQRRPLAACASSRASSTSRWTGSVPPQGRPRDRCGKE